MGLSPGNYGFLRNARQYLAQRLGARGGMSAISATPFDQLNVHSIKRMNDLTASSGFVTSIRVYGAGTKLYLGEGTPAIDFGYSGNPLSLMDYQPDQSPQTWMYVADRFRMTKLNLQGNLRSVGIEPPLAAPTVFFGADVYKIISQFPAVGSWANAGTAGALSSVARINTTITAILFDQGTTGFACVAPASFAQFGQGAIVTVNQGGGTVESVITSLIRQSFGSSTIQSITYDAGGVGLCTIQLAASTVASSNIGLTRELVGNPTKILSPGPTFRNTLLIVGREARPAPPEPVRPPGPGPNPVSPRNPSTQAVGLQPDSMVQLNPGGGTAEYVRVLSVTMGPNNSASFRCSTVNVHLAGETVTGIASFRAWFANTHAAAETLKDQALASAIGAGTGTISLAGALDLTTAPPNAIQESDNIHISVLMDHPEFLSELKIMFDVDASVNTFTQNYFYASLRQADTQQAVSSNQTALAARTQAITKSIADATGGGRIVAPALRIGPTNPRIEPIYAPYNPGGPIGGSKQASTGGSQWTELVVKVSDLIRVGADSSRTLANVAAIRVQIQTTALMNVELGDWWIGGTYGPDVGQSASPYFYRTRGRDSTTGVRSLAGPPTRSGVEPHSQQIIVQAQQHPNPAVDTIDYYRWGGTLLQWTFVGNGPNGTPPPPFLDNFSDTDIAASPLLEVDQFQPFPTIDVPRFGLCNVVGNRVSWRAGAFNQQNSGFNPQWYPGSQILINGTYYTLYSQPISNGSFKVLGYTASLETVENIGTLNNVQWKMNQATLLGVPLPYLWGPYAEGSAAFCFACGDTFQPGVLFLTNGNNPDAASDTLQTYICSPSEPLMNGCMYAGTPFVWSSERFFRLQPNLGSSVTTPTLLDPNATQLFVPNEVQGGKGLFGNWAFCVGTLIHYLTSDGIHESNGTGSVSITDEDLYLLFPHDGQPQQPITIGGITVFPPNMSMTSSLRLAEVDGFVYFDFVDTNGSQRSLVYNIITKVWGVDDYTPTVLTHYQDQGPNVHAMILGGSDGRAYLSGGATDGTGLPFPCEIRMPQLSELQGGYEVPIDGFMGLQASQPGNISLVVNVDGVDNLITVPVTTNYVRLYQRLLAVKGKILAFGLAAAFPFQLFQRDTEFRCGNWGRQGNATPINPFSDLRRSQTPKVS